MGAQAPAPIGADKDWAQVTRGAALKLDGSLWDLTGQTPVRLGNDTDWDHLGDTLAVKADGSLWSWGAYAVDYSLSPADILKRWAAPTQLMVGTDWVAVLHGDTGLKADGSLWFWGLKTYNSPYEVKPFVDRSVPVQVLTGVRLPGSYTTTTASTTTSSTTTTTTSTTLPAAPAFPDVPATHPYYAAISAMAAQGIIGGYSDGTFGPDKLVLRKHFAKMIVGAMGLAVSEADWQDASPPFTDCGPDDPASLYPHDYIAVAKAHNLTAGKTATTFAPEANITRAQMVTMVVRAAQNSGIALDPVPAGYAGTFNNYADPTHGANVKLAEANGLLTGLQVSGDPSAWMSGNATRGECAQVLWNLMQR